MELEIALTKRACPLCHKSENAEIVMNKRLTKGAAKKVKELHGQVVGFMDKPCKDCQELMSQGFLLIGIIEEKSPEQNNPYLSGNQWVIKREVAERIFKPEYLTKGVMFIDVKQASELGFPNINFNA